MLTSPPERRNHGGSALGHVDFYIGDDLDIFAKIHCLSRIQFEFGKDGGCTYYPANLTQSIGT